MSARILLAVGVLALFGSIAHAQRQGGQPRTQGQVAQGQPSWAWKPAIPTVKPGEIEVLHVRGNVHMLVGAGGNIAVQTGNEGVLLVDTGIASMSAKVLAAVKSISPQPIRYIINTNERDLYTGGNDTISAAGSSIPFRIATDVRVSDGRLGKDRANVISYLTVFNRMSAPTGKQAARAETAWPDDTYSTPQKKLNFN